MAYTFMDDYGNEWVITTNNVRTLHHRLVELSWDDCRDHIVVNEVCFINNEEEYWRCYSGRGRGLCWSELMAISDSDIDASCYWQHEVLTVYLSNLWEKRVAELGVNNAREGWFEYRMEKWFEFYSKYPEHDGYDIFMYDYKDRLSEKSDSVVN